VTRGSIALGERDAQGARRDFEHALRANPTDGRSWSGLGLASLLARQFDRAAEELRTALRHMPGHIGTWHALGWCEIVRRDLAAAGECFARALDLDHNFAESHGGLAVVAALSKRAEDARMHVQRALKLDPECVSARYAASLIGGEIRDEATFHETAERLLSGRGDLLALLSRRGRPR